MTLIPPSQPSGRGRTYGSAYMQCVTMTVYRVGSVTEKEPNPLLPSRLSAANEVATVYSQDTKAEAYIEKLTTAR